MIDSQGKVAYANTFAQRLLHPFALSDANLARLKDSAGAERIEIAPGRVLACSSQGLEGGAQVLTLLDLHPHLSERIGDPLTGLPNRAELREWLAGRLDGAGETKPVAVLFLDLNRFRAVNDTLGHVIGDALLRKVADRLRRLAGKNGIAARTGGDEFALARCDLTSLAEAEALAGRLVDVVARAYAVDGHILNIGASVGIAMAPSDGREPDDLLKKANLALHAAKAAGRGTYRFHDPHMEARLNARRLLDLDLRRALALRQFELAYQPQVELATGRVGGFEALLRWRHPDRGFVSPAEFIPLAEEIGAIVPIGEWVLRTACREAAAWPGGVGISVNLSPVQFRSPLLFGSIASALEQSGLDPARLELEITEGALLQDTTTVLDLLHRVRALGVRVSMDDFGTGYSSLSYLLSFPFDKIKIDQSFVRGDDLRGDKQAIVRAIAALGASLRMQTTAEGVETREQLERVRQEGCTEVQGYFTGRPMPAEDAARLLASASPRPT